MELKERIRRAREDAGLTQAEVARRVGRDIRTVQGWEAGRHPRSSIADLERILGADLTTPPGTRAPTLDRATEAQILSELANRIAERDQRIRDLLAAEARNDPAPDNVYDGRGRWAARPDRDTTS